MENYIIIVDVGLFLRGVGDKFSFARFGEVVLYIKQGLEEYLFRKRQVELPKPRDLSDHHMQSNFQWERVLIMTDQNYEYVFVRTISPLSWF